MTIRILSRRPRASREGEKSKKKLAPVKLTKEQVIRSQKVQAKGVNNKKAFENSKGEVVPRVNEAISKRVRLKKSLLKNSKKGSAKHKKRKKEYDDVLREEKISNKSSKKAAEVGGAQKNFIQGKGAYQDRLRREQAKKKK